MEKELLSSHLHGIPSMRDLLDIENYVGRVLKKNNISVLSELRGKHENDRKEGDRILGEPDSIDPALGYWLNFFA